MVMPTAVPKVDREKLMKELIPSRDVRCMIDADAQFVKQVDWNRNSERAGIALANYTEAMRAILEQLQVECAWQGGSSRSMEVLRCGHILFRRFWAPFSS
jgi:hypothetical protein